MVQRSTNGGAWTQVARPSGNAANWTDTTTRAGNKYDYRVAGVGGGGQSGWSNTATVYTSPNTPTGPSASREGSNIVVDVSGKPAYATGYNVRDGATQVASNVQLPWTHVNPAPANTHTYTVQAVRGSLASGWSAASNTVQLLAAPQAPTNLAPNGAVVSSEGQTRLSWRHNPTDSSPQTAAEYRRRVKGTSSWTTGTSTTASNVALTLAAGEIEWQVRTKGQHPDWSPWSAVAVFTVIDKPGVAITDPGDLWTRRTVTVKWSFDQGQGRPQSAWEASLLLGGEVIEHRTGSGAGRSVAFTTPLVDTQEYEVIVKAAAGDVWSEAGAQSFFVQVPPAAPGDMSGVWSEESGAVTVDVHDGRGALRQPITNYFPNSRLVGTGAWVELFKNWQRNPYAVGTANYAHNGGAGSAMSLDSRASNNPDGTGRMVRGTVTATVGNWSYVQITGNGATDRVPVSPGQWVAVRARVFASARNVVANMQFRAGTVFVSQSSTPLIPVTSSGHDGTLVTFAALVPEGADRVNVSFGYSSGQADVVVGSWVQVAAPSVAVAASEADARWRAEEFYKRSADTDFRVRFTGAENDSEAVLEGQRVGGVGAGARVAAVLGEIDGANAVRLIALDYGVNAYRFASASVPAALAGGGTGMARRHQLEVFPQTTVQRRGLMVSSPEQHVEFENAAGLYSLVNRFSELTGVFQFYMYHGGYPGDPDVYYSHVGVFDPGYSGPVFDGSSGLVQVGESWMGASWDGAPDNSTSTLRMAPAAVRANVERSVDGGITWVPFIEGADLPVLETDTEALSNGVTLYRVTTYSADDATSVVIHEVESDSPAVWLSGGDGYTHTARLPYDPEVSITRCRERAVRKYAGRPKPVVHAGEAVTRTVDYSGTLLLDEQSPDELADLVADEAPVHLYRDPDGRHIYGALGDVQLTRESHAHWGFGFQLTETEK
ncbi:hypothetical protein [Leucobacter sp. G161]|uniref:hypothetical protein n=1 Tax=Leucobacter sp. G161 TaxID=663704 RepID=UPI00128F8403|nr:hypothetical protein [Leucobacter sp. G161]